jgi:hypothetical protein
MTGEFLPLAWDIELGTGNIVSGASECNGTNNGSIIRDLLMCTIEIYNNNEEPTNKLTEVVRIPCNTKKRTNSTGQPTKKLFSKFA